MSFRPRPWVSWGTTACFLLALISGLILSYPYREDLPLISTAGIEGVVPLGEVFRALHYFSGELAFLLLIWHTAEVLLSNAHERRDVLSWTALVATYPLLLLALFTGYIIRGDETGLSAGRIAEHLALKIPLVGGLVNRLFFALAEDGVHRAYLAHVFVSVGLFLGLTTWHFRLRRLKLEELALWGGLSLALGLLFPPGLEAPPFPTHIKGPWFFLGIQEALRHASPYLAGLIFPALSLLFLWAYKWCPRAAGLGLIFWHLTYFLLLLAGAVR